MPKYAYMVATAGAAVLAVATVYLVWLNRSPKIYGPLMSIVLGAVVAAFITTAALLKPTRVTVRFPVSIVLNGDTGLPVLLKGNTHNADVQLAIGMRAIVEEQGKPQTFALRRVRFANREEKSEFYVEALQYELMWRCYGILRSEVHMAHDTTKEGTIVSARIFELFWPKDFLKLSGDTIADRLQHNRFLDLTQREVWHQAEMWLPIPSKAGLSIPNGRSIIIERPGYFRITLDIKSLGSAYGTPRHLSEVIQEPKVETITFAVSLDAVFDKFTSESPYTIESKRWAELLFARLKEEIADP